MPDRDRAEADEIIRAIRQGEVDAFVVTEAAEEKIYSLRGADLLYRTMIEEMKEGAVALDASGLIVYCNRHFAQLAKGERAAIIGTKIFRFVPGQVDDFFGVLRESNEHTSNGARHRELELHATDGTIVTVLAAMNRIRLDDDNHLYCLVVTDLTEQKLRDQLLTEGRRKDEFLAMLAHELRNPIAPIRYAAARLTVGTPTPDRLQWARELIDRQVDQLTRLVDDLLDVSRITRGKASLNLAPVEIQTVLNQAVEAVLPMIESRKQDLKITQPATRLWVRGDMTRLAQVISNLLHNAAKFTAERGQISLLAEEEAPAPNQERRWLRIMVTDNGVGIPSDLLPGMFGLFAQAETAQGRSQGGLGIGLTLVRSFVEMHGGTVVGASEGSGRGSTFTVRLPLMEGAPERVEPARAEAPPPVASAADTPRKILVVDDNHDVAEALAAWLLDLGHEVVVAETGEAAVREAAVLRPDVMFVDIGLPDMSGHEVARRLRRMPELAGVVLVAVSGFGKQADRRESEQAGFDHHWIKPLGSEALDELLASLGERRVADQP
ncbi:MAG TPA: ATP-binding protein [Polyangia bacterium]|nr:ATP-binding protein [Polyangia bacterium]